VSVTLTTNGRIDGCRMAHILLGRLLGSAIENGPWIMFEREMIWDAHNILPHERKSIPPGAIAEEHQVIKRVPGCLPETGVVLVLNQIPQLVSPPVCEWDEVDPPGDAA
jgi:hypothetical protein